MRFWLGLWRKITKNSYLSMLVIALLSALVAGLDFITPQEVPSDAFFAGPIWVAVSVFGIRGGIAVSCTSLALFYVSNYYILEVSDQNLVVSLVMNYCLFLLFAFGGYLFRQGRRQLLQTQEVLQTRLKEIDELHQQNLKLAITEERNRMAREIHDVLAQGLLAIVVQVEAAFINRNNPATLEERLLKVDELARYNLQEARRSVANLRPLPLDGAALWEALAELVKEFEKEKHIPATFTTGGELQPVQAEAEATIYRIAQEALSNVSRHSRAGQVEVTLDYDEEEVCLTVQDNGQGFEIVSGLAVKAGQKEKGKGRTFGLASMQERANQIGGLITIQSKPGQGTRVRLIVPYLVYLGKESGKNLENELAADLSGV